VERTVESVEVVVQRADGASRLAARLVVDASGATPVLARLGSARTVASYQTAYGAVVDAPPTGYDVDTVALMDFRPPGDDTRSTFCYVVPVADGWLVEETSLAARPAVDLAVLEARLQRRVGADLVASATRVERVSITMGLPLPSRAQHVVAFGAAASYVHPATGYSITASLRAAPRVAAAIAQAPIGAPVDPRPVWNAVWPAEQRRVRALHDYGLAALLRLQPGGVREFFDAFFSLPVERWSPYLRIDATVAEVVAVMRAVFNSVSWPVRRRLAAGNPVALARSLR
jgi:lycopene beta-cyclase